MPPSLAARAALFAVAALAVAALVPSTSRADCVDDVPNVGDVTCTNADLDGYDAAATNNRNVRVDGATAATVDNGGVAGVAAIQLNDGNTVNVEQGAAITTSGDNADGIRAGTGNTIANGGSITTTGAMGSDGIQVGNTNNTVINQITGVIDVSGADAAGIRAGDDNVVTNEGRISLGGVNGVGILAGDDTVAAPVRTVINDGRIESTATLDDLIGINIGAGTTGDMIQDVTNSGTISLEGDRAQGIVAGNTNDITNTGDIVVIGADAVGIQTGTANVVTNAGSIRAIGNAVGIAPMMGDDPVGIQLGDGDLTTLQGSSITATGDAAVGVVATGGNMIDNGGTIRATPATDAVATTAIQFTGGANTVINRGLISAFSSPTDATMLGTAIQGGAGVEMIENRGFLSGNVLLGGGDDILDLRTGGGTNGMLDGQGGDDLLRLRGNGGGFLDLGSGGNNSVLGFERLVIDPDPDMPPAGTPGNGVWELTGTGAFTTSVAINSGTLSARDTVTITTPTVTFGPSTRLGLFVDPVAGTNGRLDVVGAVALDPTSILSVVSTSGPLRSATLTVLTATGGFGGTAFGVIPSNTALLSFTVLPTANQINLQIVRNSYASLAGTSNQRAVATNLDAILAAGSTSDVTTVLSALETLSLGDLQRAYDQLHPELYDAHTGQMALIGRRFAKTATAPREWCKPALYGLRPAHRAEVPCGPRGFSTWMQAVAGFADRDAGNEFRESDSRVQGLIGGVDWRINRNWLVTGFIGIASADVEVDDAGEGDVESFELGLASVFRYQGARARAAFGYGRGSHEHDRQIRFGTLSRTAESEYDSNRIHALFSFGWVFEAGNWRLEPLAAVDVTWIQEEAFNETRAVSLDLQVEERENTIVSTGFGGRIAYRHFQNPFSDRSPGWAQGTWTPDVTARWRSTWMGADREIDARLAGAPAGVGNFSVDAQDSEQGAEFGAHITFQPHGSGGSMSIGYDGFFGDNGTSHIFGGKLRLFF